jgi:DNA-binding transcriptional ArsR family regulator
MEQIDRVIHEPVRLRALTLLSGVASAEFSFLLRVLDLTNGNLSVHMRKLEEAGYVSVSKEFVGRTPRTSYAITAEGQGALRRYWRVMDGLRERG